MSDDDEATIEAIRHRMMEVRRDLKQDLATSARDMTDWRSYVRASPWIAIASAVAVGYLLAPKGPAVVRLSGIELQNLARNGQATAMASVPQPKKSLARSLFSSLAGLAARSAMTYVTHRLTNANRPRTEENAPV